jgi:DNA modification methylase
MPESCKDRPTSSYEHVFLLSKRATYFYDADAIAEPSVGSHQRGKNATPIPDRADTHGDHGQGVWGGHDTRNARNVWTITPKPFKGAHFATMPIELAERCIKAGTRQGDTVLDPFGGAGTTALAAAKLGRESVLIELSPAYVEMAVHRLNTDM